MNIITDLQLSIADQYLLILCPIFAAIGGMAHCIVMSNNFGKSPKISLENNYDFSKTGKWELLSFCANFVKNHIPNRLIDYPMWYLSHIFISIVMGILVSLVFLGVLPSEENEKLAGGIARICALSILAGSIAPLLWKFKEKIAHTVLESKVLHETLVKNITSSLNSEGTKSEAIKNSSDEGGQQEKVSINETTP